MTYNVKCYVRPYNDMLPTIDNKLPTIDNIAEWTNAQIRNIANQSLGNICDEYHNATIYAKLNDIALTVERVTGKKPRWDYTMHTTYGTTALSSDLWCELQRCIGEKNDTQE